jgi:hypothetical protein
MILCKIVGELRQAETNFNLPKYLLAERILDGVLVRAESPLSKGYDPLPPQRG